MLSPLDLLEVRDTLSGLADDAIASAGGLADKRDSDRRYIAALCNAWLAVDREIQRLAEEE